MSPRIDDTANPRAEWEDFVKQHESAPVTLGFLDGLLESIEDIVKDLRRRVVELEQKPLGFKGFWSGEEQYDKGAITSFHGGLWMAVEPSIGRKPGENSHWRLVVKKGRDGKDAR
jgi:hypothetical protein